MALAFSHGAHVGFGFAFLNFFGTILFFIFMLFVIKMMFRGMRFSGRNSWSDEPWRDRVGGWMNDKPQPTAKDEAMDIARNRLAGSELSPKEFEVIKQGLKDSQIDTSFSKHDGALSTARVRFAKGEISLSEFEAVLKALA